MDRSEFTPLFKGIVDLYPGRMSMDSLDAWFGQFEDVPAQSLKKAVAIMDEEDSIDPRYPPNAIQMRRLARKVEGVAMFASVQEEDGKDVLRLRQRELCDEFYRQGKLDKDDWEKLSRQFKNQARHHAKDHAMEVYARLEAMG